MSLVKNNSKKDGWFSLGWLPSHPISSLQWKRVNFFPNPHVVFKGRYAQLSLPREDGPTFPIFSNDSCSPHFIFSILSSPTILLPTFCVLSCTLLMSMKNNPCASLSIDRDPQVFHWLLIQTPPPSCPLWSSLGPAATPLSTSYIGSMPQRQDGSTHLWNQSSWIFISSMDLILGSSL